MKITDDMLSAQAAEARELWLQACTPDALPEHRFSRKFRREMRRLVRAQKHSAAFNRSLRLARRTAAVLLLSAAVSFGCAMSVEAYRVSLINTVVRVFNDLDRLSFFIGPAVRNRQQGVHTAGSVRSAGYHAQNR